MNTIRITIVFFIIIFWTTIWSIISFQTLFIYFSRTNNSSSVLRITILFLSTISHSMIIIFFFTIVSLAIMISTKYILSDALLLNLNFLTSMLYFEKIFKKLRWSNRRKYVNCEKWYRNFATTTCVNRNYDSINKCEKCEIYTSQHNVDLKFSKSSCKSS